MRVLFKFLLLALFGTMFYPAIEGAMDLLKEKGNGKMCLDSVCKLEKIESQGELKTRRGAKR